MALADNTERLVEQMSLKTRPVMDERILNEAFTVLEKSPPYTHKVAIRKNLTTKLLSIAAVAALLVIIWFVHESNFNEKLDVQKQIFNELVKNNNFNISVYHAGNEQPFQQLWSLKSADMKMFRNNESNNGLRTLWDIPGKNKMIANVSSNSVQTQVINKNMLNELEESIFKVFSLAQFNNFNDIPKNAKWQPVLDENIISKVSNAQVFELLWNKKNSDGENQNFKWLFFVTENSNILRRTELYIKSGTDEQYKLDSIGIISYPDDDYIKSLIRDNFGPVISVPEYRPTGTPQIP